MDVVRLEYAVSLQRGKGTGDIVEYRMSVLRILGIWLLSQQGRCVAVHVPQDSGDGAAYQYIVGVHLLY